METRMADVERLLQKIVYAQFDLQMKMDTYQARVQEEREERAVMLKEEAARYAARQEKEAAEYAARQEKEAAEYAARQKREEARIAADREAFRREMREMNRRWGELANKMGTIVEDIVAPNMPRILREYFGVDEPVFIAQRVRRRHPGDRGKRREFDVIAVSEDTVFVNETKSTLRPGDIERFAGNFMEILEYFPEYREYRVVPIMAALSITAEELSSLTSHGIYAMAMGDETMDLLNADELLERRTNRE